MIQWYPGHMAKAEREIKEVLNQVNIVYLILDARIPEGSFNARLVEIIKDKPIIYLYNKSSLTDKSKIKVKDNENSLIIDALKKNNLRQIEPLTRKVLKPYIDRQLSRGYKTVPIKAAIMGIPNVGKSTLINALAKSKKASTNKKPGHTRNLSWTLIGNEVYLLDTPGVLYPKIENEINGYHLALTGAIKEEILPKEKLAYYAFNFLKENYPLYVNNFYNINESEPLQFFTKLCNNRGYYINNDIDLNKAYTIFLADIKDGKLGPLYYE